MQLAPLVTFALAFTMLLEKLVVQPLTQAQAQTQAQLTRVLATLEEVPRLAGRVERLDKDTDALLNDKLRQR